MGVFVRGVTQRVEGWPEGECVRASVATILGLPIDTVPRMDPLAAYLQGTTQSALKRDFFRARGYGLVEIGVEPPNTLPDDVLDAIPETLPHLIAGISPRGTVHQCVGRGGRVLWDPHPSREGLTAVCSIGILIPGRAA